MPARLAETLQGYVEQMRVTLRPNSMPHIERTLREFALLAARPGARGHSGPGSPPCAHRALQAPRGAEAQRRGGRLSKRTIAGELSTLRICLERLAEWDGEDAPARTLMFPGDVPKLDDPLPRFIDDGAAKKLIRRGPCDR